MLVQQSSANIVKVKSKYLSIFLGNSIMGEELYAFCTERCRCGNGKGSVVFFS